jgi:NADH-quinone oxidoreductase subunit N
VTLYQSIVELIANTRESAPLFLPELILCGTICVMLLARLFPGGQRLNSFYFALVGSGIALWFALPAAGLSIGADVDREIFGGMLIYDSFTIFHRCLLLFFAVLFCVLTRITGIPDTEDSPDFYTLVLGATLGMCLMVSANHLLIVFLAVEMASVPSYVLAGIIKGRKHNSEAALKYSVYGAGAAGVMLYGISLVCGILGTAHLPTIGAELAAMDIPHMIQAGEGLEKVRVLALGGLMIMVGLAFKLSAVPFHFWCPDVFEGATAEVNAFLSVASKAAALALLVRVAIGFGYYEPAGPPPMELADAGIFNVADIDPELAPGDSEEAAAAEAGVVAPLTPVRAFIVNLLAVIAIVTCTFGNLAAYGQSNIKRMLAYSTIAHAGYMIMPIATAVAVVGSDPELAQQSIAALTFYISIYMFMNLGAFAVIAFLRNAAGTEEIADYAGMIRTNPVTVICFATLLVSLIGLPPLAGFAGKLAIFLALVKAGGWLMMTLLVVAGVNTAISLVYYLRVIKVMTIDPEPDTQRPFAIGFIPAAYMVAITLPVLVFGVWFNGLYQWASEAVKHLFLG